MSLSSISKTARIWLVCARLRTRLMSAWNWRSEIEPLPRASIITKAASSARRSAIFSRSTALPWKER